ncbi:MAG: DNA primase [Deltaproteobacteria bacterium]|nr:MAG: DNA primase [Deltaproteobacteria bacterium]
MFHVFPRSPHRLVQRRGRRIASNLIASLPSDRGDGGVSEILSRKFGILTIHFDTEHSIGEETIGKGSTLAGHIPPEVIAEIRNRTNIVEVVSNFLTLKRVGRNYVAHCPFHQEKTPSFHVNEERQIYYCFGACKEGGDVFKFLMKIEGQEFYEVVRELARKHQIPLPRETTRSRKGEERKERGYRINTMAAAFFQQALVQANERVGPYLERRGISKETVERFALGYAPQSWEALTRHLARSREGIETARELGLVVAGRKGGHYDRFRGRLIFPIHDLYGRVVAFGGRILGQDVPENTPKYLNSPESFLYRKGEVLYGLYQAREEIRQRKEAIVVEGYLDLIALFTFGFRNAVATLGTALTPAQVALLKRFTPRIVTLFDGDAAGEKATRRAIELGLELGLEVEVALLPPGEDPDSLLHGRGAEALEAALSDRRPALTHLVEESLARAPAGAPGKARVVRELIPFLRPVRDPIELSIHIGKVADALGIDEIFVRRCLMEEGDRHRTPRPLLQERERSDSVGKGEENLPVAEEMLLSLALSFPDTLEALTEKAEEVLAWMSAPPLRDLLADIVEQWQREGRISPVAEMIEHFKEERTRDLLLRISTQDQAITADQAMQALHECLARLEAEYLRRQEARLQRRIREAEAAHDGEAMATLLREFHEIIRRKQKISIL